MRQIRTRQTRVKALAAFLNGNEPSAEEKLRTDRASHVTNCDLAKRDITRPEAELKTAGIKRERLVSEADRSGARVRQAREAAAKTAASLVQA